MKFTDSVAVSSSPVINVAGYKFIDLNALVSLREHLYNSALALSLKGTILVAPEGINIFLAGQRNSIEAFKKELASDTRFSDIVFKESQSDWAPFRRLRVRIKREIIGLGRPEIRPATRAAPAISPSDLKSWLDAGKDIVLLDVRNTYEIGRGTFKGATQLGIAHFRDFAVHAGQVADAFFDKPIVTFCTGGIRCEKAAPLLLNLGCKEVYQLQGGILDYLKQMGDAHFSGECFVFDEREALRASAGANTRAACEFELVPVKTSGH